MTALKKAFGAEGNVSPRLLTSTLAACPVSFGIPKRMAFGFDSCGGGSGNMPYIRKIFHIIMLFCVNAAVARRRSLRKGVQFSKSCQK